MSQNLSSAAVEINWGCNRVNIVNILRIFSDVDDCEICNNLY